MGLRIQRLLNILLLTHHQKIQPPMRTPRKYYTFKEEKSAAVSFDDMLTTMLTSYFVMLTSY